LPFTKVRVTVDFEELKNINLYESTKKGGLEFIDADLVFKEIEEARNKNESL
jgi:hypothetical protein